MICSTRSQSEGPEIPPPSRAVSVRTDPAHVTPYGRPFWYAYAANTSVMIAVALLFRYADFVTVLGGSELHLGWIVGIGMVGSLAARVFLGWAIDHHGARRVWLAALMLLTVCCLGHLVVTSYRGPAIYILRILFCCSLAGIFGASMTFISGRAPTARMAEMLGMLGTSGFVGMVFGTQIGDMLCGTETITRHQINSMFVIAGGFGGAALFFAWIATWGQAVPSPRRRPPLFWLLRRYQPGTVLLVSAAMGMGIGLPGTFLRTYAAELDITRIGLFFAVYAPTAIITRLSTRRLPERFGLRPMILAGMAFMALSQLTFLVVGSEWSLVVPGLGYGVAHAILFPATIALGSSAFPNRYRGLGTTLMLAAFDFGQLVGAPIAGWIVDSGTSLGLPGYPIMFCSVAAMFCVVGAIFAYSPSTRSEPASSSGTLAASHRQAAEKKAAEVEERLSSAP
jgi:MFS family permease